MNLPGQILISVLVACISLAVSVWAGHPLITCFLAYSVTGSCSLLALALLAVQHGDHEG